MTFTVIFEPEALADLLHLYEFQLERAEYIEDLEVAERALQAIEAAIGPLATTPFLFRKEAGGRSALRRELVVSFGGAGSVVKYEIATPELVVVLAVRHQLEGDHH